jgi:hypothetical protein
VPELAMIQIMPSYEADGTNYNLHDGLSPQNFTANHLPMNHTVKRHRKY